MIIFIFVHGPMCMFLQLMVEESCLQHLFSVILLFFLDRQQSILQSIHPSVLPSSVCRLLNIPYFQCGITISSIVCKLTSSFPQKRALIEQANKGWGGNFDLIQQIEISVDDDDNDDAKERFQIPGNNQRTSKSFFR